MCSSDLVAFVFEPSKAKYHYVELQILRIQNHSLHKLLVFSVLHCCIHGGSEGKGIRGSVVQMKRDGILKKPGLEYTNY